MYRNLFVNDLLHLSISQAASFAVYNKNITSNIVHKYMKYPHERNTTVLYRWRSVCAAAVAMARFQFEWKQQGDVHRWIWQQQRSAGTSHQRQREVPTTASFVHSKATAATQLTAFNALIELRQNKHKQWRIGGGAICHAPSALIIYTILKIFIHQRMVETITN